MNNIQVRSADFYQAIVRIHPAAEHHAETPAFGYLQITAVEAEMTVIAGNSEVIYSDSIPMLSSIQEPTRVILPLQVVEDLQQIGAEHSTTTLTLSTEMRQDRRVAVISTGTGELVYPYPSVKVPNYAVVMTSRINMAQERKTVSNREQVDPDALAKLCAISSISHPRHGAAFDIYHLGSNGETLVHLKGTNFWAKQSNHRTPAKEPADQAQDMQTALDRFAAIAALTH